MSGTSSAPPSAESSRRGPRLVEKANRTLALLVDMVGHVFRPRSAEGSRRGPRHAAERALAPRDGSLAAMQGAANRFHSRNERVQRWGAGVQVSVQPLGARFLFKFHSTNPETCSTTYPPPSRWWCARTRFPLIVSIEHDNQVVDLVGFEEPLCSMRAKIEFNTSVPLWRTVPSLFRARFCRWLEPRCTSANHTVAMLYDV